MLTDNYTEKLIGMKDAILLNIENIQDTMIIELKMEKRIIRKWFLKFIRGGMCALPVARDFTNTFLLCLNIKELLKEYGLLSLMNFPRFNL